MEAISLFNSSISENQNQLTAIACILNRPPGSMPFIITGPPGTGKTIIIVEAIRQLLHRDPASRILVCASPYGAADMICEHLIPLGSEKVFRCNSPTRPPATIPPVLKDFCEKGDFRERMKECQVVISSAMSCMGFPSVIGRDHFTHIFIDNAGQVSEPKVMVPILELGGLQTNIILSGDPSQIRPNAKSSISRKLGLGTSYMERLMHLPVYDEKLYGGITIVRLTDNIRSHPDILKVPKEELYQSEIKHRSISEFHDRLSVWRGLPKKGFPIIFHSLEGQDERHPSSSSIFNLDEAFAVRKYVQNLCSDGLLNLTDNHIGVISPYKGQNIKIRGMLRARNPMIKVDSPDDFQGQERQVIIISTVRSRVDTVAQDLDHNLGFLGQPRRFNVAINLAQALLIVIGNPNVLGLDPLWRTFLNHVHRNGGWRGSAIPWDPREVVNIPAISVEAEADMNEDELVEQVRLLALEERKRQERFSCDQNEGDHYISL
ncbi:hypothetical protein FRC03_010834 [Tulasnella sp. 419]|nr:hypothetical protein FRC03_010834 [Tulasnella sp. 419]